MQGGNTVIVLPAKVPKTLPDRATTTESTLMGADELNFVLGTTLQG